jgi:phosphoribosyl 1,2-cyclic phosphate phosphodiesterase
LWVDKALEYVERLKPRRTFFTHIAHDIKHARDSARLPPGVEFAYDGLVVESSERKGVAQKEQSPFGEA